MSAPWQMELKKKSSATTKMDGQTPHWITLQKKVFNRWCNAYLKLRKLHIDDIYTGFADGVLLIELLEILGHDSVGKYRKNPEKMIHKKENLKKAFDHMKKKGVKLLNVGAEDIEKGNEKIILGLMWAIIQHYQLSAISAEGISGKDGLMLWAQRLVSGYVDAEGNPVVVKDFTRSWTSGLAFCSMLDKTHKGVLDFEAIRDTGDPATILTEAFKVAEESFGIEPLLDLEDLLDAPGGKPDDKIIMTQLCFYFKEFARHLKEQNAVKSITAACNITRRHDGWIQEYNTSSTELLSWIAGTIGKFNNTVKGAEGFGDTTALIEEKRQMFSTYRKEEKPDKKTKMVTNGGLLSTLQASCRNNHRPVHTPPDEISMTTLAAEFGALEAQETVYEKELISTLILFQNLDADLSRFGVKAEKAMGWLSRTQEGVFDSLDYGVTSTATDGLFENLELCMGQMELYQEYPDKLKLLINSEGMDLHADKPAALVTLAKLEETLEKAVEAASAYGEKLEISKAEHIKSAELAKVHGWIDGLFVVFQPILDENSSSLTGSNTKELEVLIEQFELKYSSIVDQMEEKITSTEAHPEAPQVGIPAQIEEISAHMTALRESGEQYREKLSARLEYLNGYLAMIRAFNEASAELTISLDDLSEGLRAPLEVASELEAVNMVENFQGVLQPSYVQLKTKFDALEPQGLELEEIAVQEEEIRGALTLYHVGDLRKALTILETTMSQREEELTGSDGLLKKEKQKEKKRVEFAMAATMLKKFITKNTHELGKLEDEMAKTENLQPMLAKFQEFNNACQMETDDTMDRLGPMQDALDAAGVADNAHTPETVDSLRAASTMLLSRISVDMTSLESKIEIEEGHKRMAKEYDERADAFMAWIEGKMDTFQSREEGNKGFGDSTASIKETISVILKYKLEELPPMLQEQSSLSNHLVNLHNGQRSIHRPVHVPQDGRGTEDLAEKWDSLATVLVEYENAVRDSLAMFSTMESELLLITSKCGRVGEWIVVQQQVLESHDYGNSLAGTRALEDNYNLFLKQLEVQKQAPVKVREALASNPRYELHAEYHVAIGKVEKLEKGLGEIETKGKYYLQGVRLSAQEYEKLSRLIEPEHWADQIDAVFEKADLGNNLADVQQRVSAFEENYTARLQEYLKMTEEMALMTNMSQQNYNRASVTSCMTKLDMVTLKLTALQAKATEYQQSLLTRQEVLTALIESMNEFNTMAAEFDVMVDALDEELSTPLIADSMEDVDNEISRFDEETREAMNAVTHKYTDIDTVARELLESEEVLAREAFARYELNNLYNRWQAIDQRTDEREMELKAEGTGYWAIEQHKENLRIEFAEKASIIRQYCTEKTDIVSSLSGDLDEQVATLAALKSDYDTSTLLTDVEPITQGLEEFMVLSNQHTADNYFTLKGQWEALGKVFGEASGSLQEQIMAEKGRQITPEQMAEIIEVFEFFDTDNSGFLTETEFWSCCTGIGLVLTKDEVESTFASLDTSGDQNVSLDEFSIWMADRLTQPSAASGDVVEAFHIINEWPVEYPPREEVKNSVANVRIKQCFFETETRDYLVESMGPHKCDLPAEVVEQAAEDQSADEDPTSKLEYTIVPYVDELFSR